MSVLSLPAFRDLLQHWCVATSRVGRRTIGFSSQLTTPIHSALFAPMCGLWAVSVREWTQWMQRRARADSLQVVRAEILADFGEIVDVAWT